MTSVQKSLRILALSFIVLRFGGSENLRGQVSVDAEHVTIPFSRLTGADIYTGGNRSLHIIGQAVAVGPDLFGVSGYKFLVHLTRDSSGDYTLLYLPDTGWVKYVTFASRDDHLSQAVAFDSADNAIIVSAKQEIDGADIAPFEYCRAPRIRAIREISVGAVKAWLQLFEVPSSGTPAVAVGPDQTVHFAWEAQSPLHADSNFSEYASTIWYRYQEPGGTLSQSYIAGLGVSPRLVAGAAGSAQLFWLRADSSTSPLFSIRTMKFSGAKATFPSTVRAFLYYPRDFAVTSDTSANFSLVWSEERLPASRRIFYLRYHAPISTTIDSSDLVPDVPGFLASAPNQAGRLDLAWSGSGNPVNIFHVETAGFVTFNGAPSFTTAPMSDVDAASLFIRPDGGSGGIFSTLFSGGIGYLRGFEDTNETMTVFPGVQFINGSHHPSAIDACDKVWVLAGKQDSNYFDSYDPYLVSFSGRTTGVGDRHPLPSEFFLGPNYPNPFNPTTTISYGLAERTHVVLAVYDLLGREVARLVDATKPAGAYAASFSASNLASGIYFYRLTAGTNSVVRRMVLLK